MKKNIITKLNKLDVRDEIIYAQLVIKSFILDHKNAEIWDELSFTILNNCSTFKSFIKFSIIKGSQNHHIQSFLYISNKLFYFPVLDKAWKWNFQDLGLVSKILKKKKNIRLGGKK